MNTQDILSSFIEKCHQNLLKNKETIELLKYKGIKESFIFENLRLGFADNFVYQSIGENNSILEKLNETCLYTNNAPQFNNLITIPIYDENKTIVNITFYNPNTKSKNDTIYLNESGIFNSSFLKNNSSVIFTKSCIETLLLIQENYHNTTFIFGDDKKYLDFILNSNIRNAVFTFDGKASLIYQLQNNNIAIDQIAIDFDSISNNENQGEYLERLFENFKVENNNTIDVIEIESGFIFTFPHITYRIIGNFYEHSISLKVNIRAIKNNEVFINSIDLYKNRERQNFIFNLMDKFGFRDHIELENDFSKIIEVIENFKEKKQNENKDEKIIFTDAQTEKVLDFLKNPNLLIEIEKDITTLGYVNERKNKILTYLIMTSRLMDDPLHAVVVARSSAGKSRLIEIIEKLCPKNDLKSISDLTSQALYYVQENELKNKFIVIGEKEGSKGSEYPLRELISKKTISKSVPIKDTVT
ncbi:MAG: hypothetical protein JXB50_05340, partial [Spirochaetes bacterium]|nr:hypothetical protein [Spirochaetota bacterium]